MISADWESFSHLSNCFPTLAFTFQDPIKIFIFSLGEKVFVLIRPDNAFPISTKILLTRLYYLIIINI